MGILAERTLITSRKREAESSRMDVPEKNMTEMEMLEKITELDYNQSQLRDLNTQMRHWLDVADEDMAALRSENIALQKQVKALRTMISDAQHVETEPCRSKLTDDLDAERCSEREIQRLEEESTKMKEQNKKLSAELKSLQQQRESDKISLSNFKDAIINLEFGMEEAQVGLQHRDEIIHQKNVELKHSEETVEEYSIIINDLRLTNQELRRQLEDRQDEASLSVVNDLTEEKEGSLGPTLSLLDEIKLLASSEEVKTSVSDSEHLIHEETEAWELLEPHSLRKDLHTKRCTGPLGRAIQIAGWLMMCILILLVLAFVASGSFGSFSINTFWTSACLMLQPYCRVHYGALPPV